MMYNSRLTVRFLTFATLAFILCVPIGCVPNYSTGERAGIVTKLSRKGIVFKSWEGELNQGGMRRSVDAEGNSSIVPNTLTFNVQDPAVIEDLQRALLSGEHVTLTYRQWLIAPMTIDNNHVITNVEFHTNTSEDTE